MGVKDGCSWNTWNTKIRLSLLMDLWANLYHEPVLENKRCAVSLHRQVLFQEFRRLRQEDVVIFLLVTGTQGAIQLLQQFSDMWTFIVAGCRRRLASVGLAWATHWSSFWMNNTELWPGGQKGMAVNPGKSGSSDCDSSFAVLKGSTSLTVNKGSLLQESTFQCPSLFHETQSAA